MLDMEIPATLAACGAPKFDQAAGWITSKNSLDILRAQSLAQVFALPPETALMVSELAFGKVSR